ncbi:MAG TPA: hypothetical protein VNV39_13710 [Stellaceae bacterium]|nr:hypothetical protein [Stellaceae bacterium]
MTRPARSSGFSDARPTRNTPWLGQRKAILAGLDPRSAPPEPLPQ